MRPLKLALAAVVALSCQQQAAPPPVPVAVPKPETVIAVKTPVGQVTVVQPDGWLGKAADGKDGVDQVVFSHERLGLNISVLLSTITPERGMSYIDVCTFTLLTLSASGRYDAVENVPTKGATTCRIEGRTKEVRVFVVSAPVKGVNDVVVSVGGKLPLNSDWATVDAAIESIIAKTAK